MREAGIEALGVDPEAPDEPGYHRVEFERFEPKQPVNVVVACTSPHHVARLDGALTRVRGRA